MCGVLDDGCGNVIQCGSCAAGELCNSGTCISADGGACTPQTCAVMGIGCGMASDGCAGTIDCGGCPSGQTCGTTSYAQCGTTATNIVGVGPSVHAPDGPAPIKAAFRPNTLVAGTNYIFYLGGYSAMTGIDYEKTPGFNSFPQCLSFAVSDIVTAQ
jgi:hypothetical protein